MNAGTAVYIRTFAGNLVPGTITGYTYNRRDQLYVVVTPDGYTVNVEEKDCLCWQEGEALLREQARAQEEAGLFASGYRVRAGAGENELLVRNPAGRVYVVNPVTQRCSCPSTRPCKHLKQIAGLVADQFAQVNDSPSYDLAIFNLMVRFDAIRAAMLVDAKAA